MGTSFTTFAEAASSNMFTSLGIDWKMLIFQGIAFLILVGIMAKWVFPPLLKAVDNRQAQIESSTKAAVEAEQKAEAAEAKIESALKTARTEATDIVATAKLEATNMIEKAQSDAKIRSERLVAEAHDDIAKDVLRARKTLEKDTLSLVKQAAGLATLGVADSKLDAAIVKKSVERVKK